MHGDATEVGAVWGRQGEEAVGIYAWWCHGSRGHMKPVMGRRPWGYMHGGAMEVEAVWGQSWGGGRGDICMGMPWK